MVFSDISKHEYDKYSLHVIKHTFHWTALLEFTINSERNTPYYTTRKHVCCDWKYPNSGKWSTLSCVSFSYAEGAIRNAY